jgi:AraC-like DNA-binding protein
MKGKAEKKEVLLAYLEQVMDHVYFERVRFGTAEPLPPFGTPLNFYSRINMPLNGKTVITAAYDGEIRSEAFLPGDILFTGQHGWARAISRDAYSKAVSVVFMPSYTRVVYSETDEFDICYNPWYHTCSGPKDITLHILQALNKLMLQRKRERNPMAICLIKSLLYELIDELKNEEADKAGKSKRTFQSIKDYMHQNYYKPVNRETVCDELHLNASYVSTLFKQFAGENFNRYLNRIRMEKATFILKHYDDISIEQVAVQCGFSSEGYFIKAFKKFYGTTPGLFRHNN